MRRLLAVIVLAGALALILAAGCRKVSKKKCNEVRNGMDIIQVAKVLGSRGEERSTGSTAGADVTHRSWANSDGSSCDVMFRKGKVYKKIWTD